jgi:hypothetical protein
VRLSRMDEVAGRTSVNGPAQYLVDAGLGRVFRMGNRLNLDWRCDAANVLNQVTFSSVNILATVRSSACRTGRIKCAGHRAARA